MKKVLKVLVIIAVIAALGAAGYFYVLPMVMGGSGMNENIAYVTPVLNTNLDAPFISNRYSAVIESQEVVSVDSDMEKKIKTVYVKAGSTVKKGDKLFEYDIEEMQFQLEQSKLDREQAQSEINSYNEQIANLEKEQRNATKNQKLSIENQIEQTRLELKKAQYRLDSLAQSIKKLENSVKNAVVKSSVDGVVDSVDDPTAAAFITITSSGDFRVKAFIGEDHVSEFYVDEPITVRSRTNETLTWTGSVVSIDTGKPSTSTTQGMTGLETTTKYPVYISLDSFDGLLIGQHVTVEEDLSAGKEEEETTDALTLADFYVCDAEASPYVWVEENGVLAKRSVTLGEHNDSDFTYEITSGLEATDFIAFPEDRLFEGMETVHGFEESGALDAEIGELPADPDVMG